VELAGRPLVAYPLDAAAAAGLPAVVVAKAASALPVLEVPVIHEPEQPRHPLCGIVAALRERRSPLLAVGCDMPFLTGELLTLLARSRSRATVLAVGGATQPLPALYLPEHLPALELALDRSFSLRETLASLHPLVLGERELRRLGDPRRLLFGVNDDRDLRTARLWLAAGSSRR
jgi:molybdopterin-guanine dinucleotide biosynthesis protein A